jgi:hypothetical protein
MNPVPMCATLNPRYMPICKHHATMTKRAPPMSFNTAIVR